MNVLSKPVLKLGNVLIEIDFSLKSPRSNDVDFSKKGND